MATDSEQPREVRPAGPGHEPSDITTGRVFGLVLFLALSVIAIHFIAGAMMNRLKKVPPPTDQWGASNRPAGTAATTTRAPFPRLQVAPPVDLEAFQAREEIELHSYGWVNRSSGIVRIPIERAIELLLQKGLPARSGTNQVKLGPSSYELQQQRVR